LSYTSLEECMKFARFGVIGAALLGINVFWDVTPCRWVSGSQRFEGSCCRYPQESGCLPGRLDFDGEISTAYPPAGSRVVEALNP
jgi:hypothetical protein